MKYGTRLDELIGPGAMRPPNVIKLDVDGNEARIMRGMQELLTSRERPRVISVEVNARKKDALFGIMEAQGYAFSGRNDTMGGLRQINTGADPEVVAYGAIFRPERAKLAAC